MQLSPGHDITKSFHPINNNYWYYVTRCHNQTTTDVITCDHATENDTNVDYTHATNFYHTYNPIANNINVIIFIFQ